MDDDLPSPAPKKSSNNESAANASHDEGKNQPKKEVKPRQRKAARKWLGLPKSKWRELFAILLLIPWVWNDFSEAHNFFRICLLAVTLAIAQGIVCSFWGFNKKTISVWVLSLFPIGIGIWINSQPEPRPHFTVTFQTDDTFPIVLTNECLYQGRLERVGTNSSKSFLFNNFVFGCIIIPVDTSKTNVVFDFSVQNDSAVEVGDMSMCVGFPNTWNIGIDTTRWKVAGEHWVIQGWELQYTNLQSWAVNNPWPMFPSDSIEFSITNFGVQLYTNSPTKSGSISLVVRSTGFEDIIAANLVFFPKDKSFVKPIVAKMVEGTNGLWHISMTQKEVEDSQK